MRTVSRREWLVAATACAAGGLLGRSRAQDVGLVTSDEEMVVIPAGKFLMGTTEEQARDLARRYGYHVSWLRGETPQREVELPAFAIDRYPVTNWQFARFCEETGYRPRHFWGGPQPPEGLFDHPVVEVNLADAAAYAAWAGKRLPTEAEWEKAARGTDGRMWPWGNEWDPSACCWNRRGAPLALATEPVTSRPEGASPYGIMHMVGNVAEYCADGPGPGAAFIKGGSWMNAEVLNLRPAARNMSGFANNAASFYGFRCAKDVV